MQPLTTYAATLTYMQDLIARPITPRGQVGLARAEALLAAMGHPERRFATIQVAGTNGKGSTTTMAAAILRAAGLRTGDFTSPHLQSFRERIALDGAPVDPATWTTHLERLRSLVAAMERNELTGYTLGRPAFLEVLWTMACLIYAEWGARCVVAEAGMGGRLDATTANAARVAVITNVSLDHTEHLGPTVEAIAAEKAGLIKPGQRVITAARAGALAVIRAVAASRGATLWEVGEEAQVGIEPVDGQDEVFTIRTPLRVHTGLRLGMRGAHQRLNAACAVAAVDALTETDGVVAPPSAVAEGLATAAIPGRLELIAGEPEVLLDGAHNAAGAASLAEALQACYPGRRIVLILGILGDKDLATITNLLAPLAAAVVVAEPPYQSRAGFAARVAELVQRHGKPAEVVAAPDAALERARALAEHGDLIVVAGSLYLVGAIRDLFYPALRDPDPA